MRRYVIITFIVVLFVLPLFALPYLLAQTNMPAGFGNVAVGSTTAVINNTNVTANSQILITQDASLSAKLGVTCSNSPIAIAVMSRTAGKNFSVTISSSVSQAVCFSYSVVTYGN